MNSKYVFFICAIITTISAAKKTYDGYQLYKIIPKSDSDVRILETVQKEGLAEFWTEYFKVDQDVKVMVSPRKRNEFLEYLGHNKIEAIEVINDIQATLDNQMKPPITRADSQSYLSYTWSEYHDLEMVYKWLDELEANHPDIVKTVVMGQSVENRQIKGIIINHNPEKNKPLGIIEGTLHAREWITTATVTWFIKEFLTSTDPEIKALAENIEWHIFPVVNPDGYAYTFSHDRMWRKNRSPLNATTCPGTDDDMSHGVDLNRNFDVAWMTVGASSNPCLNTFAGPVAFSEPEARAIANYVINLNAKGDLIYYLSYHSYSQLIIVPYSHVPIEDALLSGNYGDMYEVGIKSADAMKKRYGTEYRVGLAADVLYPMSGASFDWVKYATNVPISYLIELRDLGEFGFLLPPSQIIPTSLESMDGLIEIDKVTRRLGYYSSSSNSMIVSTFVVFLGVFMVILY